MVMMTWQVTEYEEVPYGSDGAKGKYIVFDVVSPCPEPGMFVTMKAKGTDGAMEGITLVSTVGEKAAAFLSPMRRVSPALQEAFSQKRQVEVSNELHGRSTLESDEIVPYLLLNAGVAPLATTPLISLLRWEVPRNRCIPKVVWVVYSTEEFLTMHACLKLLPKKICARHPIFHIVLAGQHNDFDVHIKIIEDMKQYTAPKAITYTVNSNGAEEFPRIVKQLCAEHKEKNIGIETFGSNEMHSQLKIRVPSEWGDSEDRPTLRFGVQRSFGYAAPKAKNSWVEYEPWPVTSWLPPCSFAPYGVGASKMGFQEWLFLPTDPLPLALFRAIFGFLIVGYAVKAITSGRVWRDHVWSDMRFKYDYMEFLGPELSDPYCYYVYYVMGVCGFFLMIGWPYRLASMVYTATFVWHFFSEATHYNNHYYLMFTLGFILTAIDANASLVFNPVSMLGRLLKPSKKVKKDDDATEEPETEERVSVKPIPYLHHFLLRGFVLFVFFYGFVAKLNNDWISGHVMRAGLEGELPHWSIVEACVFFLSWGGIIFDGIGPLYLCHNPLRIPALGAFVFFNVSNMVMFNIGVFPWMMLGSIPILTETRTTRLRTRQMCEYFIHLQQDRWWKRLAAWTGNKLLPFFPAYTDGVHKLFLHETYYSQPNGIMKPSKPSLHPKYSRPYRFFLTLGLAAIIIFHFGYPLRSWWYHFGTDQHVAWTEHGRKFSWHMMSRHKECRGTLLVIHEQLDLETKIHINQDHYTGPIKLNSHQLKKLCTIATYVRQLAWKTRKFYEEKFIEGGHKLKIDTTDDEGAIKDMSKALRIYADVSCSTNGAPMQPFINSSYDLSRQLPPQPPGKREPWILNQTKFGNDGYADVFPHKIHKLYQKVFGNNRD